MALNLEELNSLFPDTVSPFDIVSWLLTQKYYQTRSLPFTRITSTESNEIIIYIPFIWSSSDSEIKAINIVANYSTNHLEIYPCQIDESNRPYFLISITSTLEQGYNDVCEVSTLQFMDTKDELVSLHITVPSYASSGKSLISALFAIGRVFLFKWFFAVDDSTIDCGIPFLIYSNTKSRTTNLQIYL